MTGLLLSPKILVGGSELPGRYTNEVTTLRIERGLCVVGRATLRIRDSGMAAAEESTRLFGMGSAFQCQAAGSPIFSGEITGVTVEHRFGEVTEFVVVAHEVTYKLTRDTTPVTYKQATYTDVVKQICSKYGLTTSGSLDSTQYEYLLQTGTPLDMIDTVTQRSNAVWLCEDKQLVVQAAGTGKGQVTKTLHEDLLEWSVRASALRPDKVSVSGWLMDQQAAAAETSSSVQGPSADLAQPYVHDLAKLGGPATASPRGVSAVMSSEAKAVAAAELQRSASESVTARGMCLGDPMVVPGVSMKVERSGAASGTYVVSEIEHIYTHRGFYTKFVAGPLRPTTLVDTIGPPVSAGLTNSGIVIGIVTNNNDTEGGYGRVKVKFPLLGDQIESGWARVSTPGGGTNYGAVFQYEVGDEVLVGFEGGDTRRPVILGGLYSKKVTLPEASKLVDAKSSKVVYRRMTSRQGNVIEFCEGDAAGTKKHVQLQVGHDPNQLTLAEDRFMLEVSQGDTITIKSGQTTIEVASSGDVTVKAPNITLEAQQQLKLNAMEIAIQAKSKLSLAALQINAKADLQTEVEGSAMLTLKGGLVKIN